MFDGIDHATLLSPDVESLADLYVGHLGFREVRRDVLPSGSAYEEIWGLPPGPIDVRTVEKPGAAGGGLRLAGATALPRVDEPRSMAQPGPFALDFYVRDLPGLHARLAADGYEFRSEPVSYPLFGTDFSVDEVLLEAPLGLVHAFVEYLPDRHRCVLGDSPDEEISECVAAITVVEDVDRGLRTLRDSLGGQVYFDEVFRGDIVERLIGLPEGSAFRATLLRGPSRRNARAELMEVVPDAPAERTIDRPPSVVLSLSVEDVDRAVSALRSDEQIIGPLTPVDGPHAGQQVAGVVTGWGARLELVERTPE